MNYKEFAQKIKAKYPDYEDMDDLALSKAMIAKFPGDYDDVSFDDSESSDLGPVMNLEYRLPDGTMIPEYLQNQFELTPEGPQRKSPEQMEAEKMQGAAEIVPSEQGLHRYFFTRGDGEKVDISFEQEPTEHELKKFSIKKGYQNFEPVQSSFGSITGSFGGNEDLKEVAVSVFPRMMQAAAKGKGPIDRVSESVMDVASYPFRVGAGGIDMLAGARIVGDKKDFYSTGVPSSGYIGGTTEDYRVDPETGEVLNVPRAGVSEFGQEVIRAPENIFGFGGGAVSRSASMADKASKLSKSRALMEGYGNVAGELMRAESEDRQVSPFSAIVGGLAPQGAVKLGSGMEDQAVEALVSKIKIRPSDKTKRFGLDERVLFDKDLIPLRGGARGIYQNISEKVNELGKARAKLAEEYSNTTRQAGSLEEIERAADLGINADEIFDNVMEVINKTRAKARITGVDKTTAIAKVKEQLDDLKELSAADLNRMEKNANITLKDIAENPRNYSDGLGRWYDVAKEQVGKELGMGPGEMSNVRPEQLLQKFTEPGALRGFLTDRIARGVVDESQKTLIPIEQLLGARSRWFERGNVNVPGYRPDDVLMGEMAQKELWDASSEAAHRFDDVSKMSTELKELIPLEHAIQKRLPSLDSYSKITRIGGVSGNALGVVGRMMTSNPSLLMRYKTGKMLQQVDGNLFGAMNPVGYRPYLTGGAREAARGINIFGGSDE